MIRRRDFITLLGGAELRRQHYGLIPPGQVVHRPDSPRREASQPAGPLVHDLTCIHTLEVASLLARLALGP